MTEVFSHATQFAAQFFARTIERPNHPALVVPSADISLTFQQLSEQVQSLAQDLSSQKIGPRHRVGIQLPNRTEFVVSLLALSAIGAVPVLLDTSYQTQEVETILQDSGASGFITLQSHAKSYPELTFAALDSQPGLGLSTRETSTPNDFYEDVALMKYTSGSTGIPKGVLLTGDDIVAEGANVAETLSITEEDVILAAVPLFHSYGFDFCVMPMLLKGAPLILMERFLPRPAIRILQDQKVTLFPAVPFMFDLMTRVQMDGYVDFPSMRYCISAAAPLSARTVRRFYKAFQQVICQNYGSSEAGAITLEIRRKPGVPSTCLGKSLHRVILKILDDDGNPQLAGEVGEVVVGGPQVSTHGYYNDPALTEATFQNGYCYTGDLGYLDEQGNLFLSGRKKNLINVGGKKVSPTELEEVLREHPEVLDIAVVGVEDEVLGEVVKACVVTANEVTVEELVSYCKEKVAGYKVPQRWAFWKELPRTRVGKLDMPRLKG